ALGLYTVGDKLAALATRETIGPIEQALFPGLRAVVHEPERLKRGYLRAQAVIAAAAMPVGMLFALQAEVVVRLVLGEKWLDA
ncbi:lipopolysaccharide biosynthesis protein, partial [Klebsiella pneumoniae]|nr:lipopolysaccharide biosynthesis protein [Klebsiella pneumoniae]